METLVSSLISLILVLQSSSFGATSQQTTKAPLQTIRNGSLPAVSPDGSLVVFSSNRYGADDLFVIKIDGSGEIQLTRTPEHESVAGWSADSKRLLFAIFKDGSSSIFSIDVDGKNQRLIGTVQGRSPMVSPDEKQVIYASGTWTEMSLWLSKLDGSSPLQLNDGKSVAWNIHWSPDGKQIAFTGTTNPKSELAVFVMNADGSGKRQVSQVPLEEGAAQAPVWSADGRQLAIQVDSRVFKNSAHIWIVDLPSGESRKLAAHSQPYLDETPSWFPDGKRIAFQSDRSGRMEIWIMNSDGTKPVQLTR